MAGRFLRMRSRFGLSLLAVLAVAELTGAVGSASGAEATPLVPVQAILPKVSSFAPDIALTGEIQARVPSNVAFRISGKVTGRRVEVGEHVDADTVLATLDPTERQADVVNAQAVLNSALALLLQAQTNFQRQQSLVASGYTTRATFDQAQETLNTTQA
jgi:multidrug efflux pump subunit AcrA (membrane-fusion protein)